MAAFTNASRSAFCERQSPRPTNSGESRGLRIPAHDDHGCLVEPVLVPGAKVVHTGKRSLSMQLFQIVAQLRRSGIRSECSQRVDHKHRRIPSQRVQYRRSHVRSPKSSQPDVDLLAQRPAKRRRILKRKPVEQQLLGKKASVFCELIVIHIGSRGEHGRIHPTIVKPAQKRTERRTIRDPKDDVGFSGFDVRNNGRDAHIRRVKMLSCHNMERRVLRQCRWCERSVRSDCWPLASVVASIAML